MAKRCFKDHHRDLLCEAQVIAEEMTSDFFKLNHSHWQRCRYDILTLEHLGAAEVSPHAQALLAKYQGLPPDRLLTSAAFDFYRICLQDHNILKALASGQGFTPLPLFSYIFTHELVHMGAWSGVGSVSGSRAGWRRGATRRPVLIIILRKAGSTSGPARK